MTTIKLMAWDSSKNEATVQVNGSPYSNVKVEGTNVKVEGYGTLNLASTSAIEFTADAALTGEVSIEFDTSVAGAKLAKADFSKASGVKFAGTADTTDIIAGAGNDLVSLAAGATKTTVTLGAGADTLDISAVTGTGNKVFDYNYFEGDVIKVANNDKITLGGDGKVTVSTSANKKVVADKVSVQDDWYGVKVNNGTADVDYFAVAGNNLNVTKDLSKSTVVNKVDASGAKTANITLGQKNDEVTLAGAGVGADTIKIGKDSGSNTISGFEAKNDVFAIDGVKLAEITLGATSNSVDVKYGNSTVASGVETVANGNAFNINDGSKTHKMAYVTTDANATIDYKTYSDADWFYSANTEGKTVLEVGSTTHLHDITKYKNITNIKVAADAKLDAPISLTGAIGANNTIDASAAKVGTAVWGFSEKDDSIKLGAGQDTVWFGAGDGNDTISGFKYGTASDSDVLYLKDTQSLKDIKAAHDTTANFTVGNAVAKVGANTGTSDVAQIKLADEKTYKVAGEFKKADTVDINTDAIDGLDYYAFAGDKKAKAVNISGSKDWLFHSLYTDFYTTGATIATIDASKATGNVTLAAAASIAGGGGTNNIWTYQANTSASVTAGKGTDIIWFAENADKDVSVTSFDIDKDIVKFATAQSLKEIAQGYTFASGGAGQATITGATNTDSQLILDKNGTINLVDGNDKAYKAMINDSTGASAEFSTDVNIYAGMTTLNAGGSVEGTVSLRLGKESRGLSSDTYFIDDKVTTFNASKSSATFWVAGNANVANTITGGMTENHLYGGGASADKLEGSVLAKDTFYFGTGDGVDTISGGVDTKDTIALWNIADADIANVKVSVDTEKNTVSVSLTDSSTLNITDPNAISALKNGLTFTSASQTAYTYDSESKTLVKKA